MKVNLQILTCNIFSGLCEDNCPDQFRPHSFYPPFLIFVEFINRAKQSFDVLLPASKQTGLIVDIAVPVAPEKNSITVASRRSPSTFVIRVERGSKYWFITAVDMKSAKNNITPVNLSSLLTNPDLARVVLNRVSSSGWFNNET